MEAVRPYLPFIVAAMSYIACNAEPYLKTIVPFKPSIDGQLIFTYTSDKPE